MPETATTNPGMPDRARALVAWLLAPATEEVPRHHQLASAALRILLGLMWLYNVAWKRAPDFGREAGNGLYKFTSYAVSDPVFPPYSWVVEHVVLKAFTPFGWLVLAMETLLAVLLLTGAWVRLAALVGVAQSLAIGLSVAYAPHEWPWSYWLMIGAHVAILGSSAGRVLAVDAVRAGLTDGRLLRRVFGGVAVLLGVVAVLTSFGDPLAARGTRFGSTDLSVSLGEYNLLGGLVLMLVGAWAAGAAPAAPVGYAVAGFAAVAALSLYAQNGFTDPLLGGSPTAAAFFLSLALVALALARRREPAAAD